MLTWFIPHARAGPTPAGLSEAYTRELAFQDRSDHLDEAAGKSSLNQGLPGTSEMADQQRMFLRRRNDSRTSGWMCSLLSHGARRLGSYHVLVSMHLRRQPDTNVDDSSGVGPSANHAKQLTAPIYPFSMKVGPPLSPRKSCHR